LGPFSIVSQLLTITVYLFCPGIGTSDFCWDDTYRGPKPFSEVEVRNVANFLGTLNLKSYWNVHAYSQLVLTPWSWTKTRPVDNDEMVSARKMK